MIISGDDPVSKGAQRFEVFTGAGKRREWPPEVKASIVAECYSGRDGVSAVARRHGLDPLRFTPGGGICGSSLRLRGILPSEEPEAVAFVPAVIEPSAVSDPAPTRRPRRRRRTAAAAVELEIDGSQ
jgi:transposase